MCRLASAIWRMSASFGQTKWLRWGGWKQLVVSALGGQGSTGGSRSASFFEKRRRRAPSGDLGMEFTQQKALKSLSINFIKSVGLYAVFSMRTAIHQPPIFDCGLGIGPPTRCQRGQLWPMAERYRVPHTAIPAKEPGAERPSVGRQSAFNQQRTIWSPRISSHSK